MPHRTYLEIRPQLFDFLKALLHRYVRIDVINSIDKTERLSVGNAVWRVEKRDGKRDGKRTIKGKIKKQIQERPSLQAAYLNLLMAGNSNPPDVSRKSH